MSYCLHPSALLKLTLISSIFISGLFFTATVNAFSSIEKQAQAALEERFSADFEKSHINIVINSVNDQIKQRKCKKIHFTLPEKIPSGGRFSIRASCYAPQKWMTYITGRMSIIVRVAISARPISKGQSISVADLQFKPFNITKLNRGFFKSPEQIIGQVATRNISAGKVLATNMIKPRSLIKKGDALIIEAKTGSLTVRMSGKALQSGHLGEQISVLNNKSGRTIRGFVHARGVVRVIQ